MKTLARRDTWTIQQTRSGYRLSIVIHQGKDRLPIRFNAPCKSLAECHEIQRVWFKDAQFKE